MAIIPSYLLWVPKTGTGNAQIKINSVSPYTGRVDRSTSVPGKIVGKSNSVTVTVLEKATDEFITHNGLTINVAKGGETIHVTGKSNSKLLTFTWKTNFGIADVTSFKVNGSTTATSGTDITGDPGATGEYTYVVTVVVPKNETIKARSATLEIKGEGSTVVKTITITQALGDSYLYLNLPGTTTATVTIPKGGGEQTLSVLSNDEWTFEPAEPTIKQYYIHAVTEESVNITTGVHGYLWNNNSWVEQTLQGGAMGFAYTGEPGTSIRVKFTATGYNDTEKDIVLEDGSTEPIDVKVVMTEETPPQPTTKEYFVFAVTEKNVPVETVTAASVLVDGEWMPQDLRTVVASIGFNYTVIPGTVIKVKFVATGFITEEIDVTLQTESDASLIIPVTLHFKDGIDYMQIEGDGTKHPIFRVGNVESN